MKKLIAAALMAAMITSLSSCGNAANTNDAEYIYGKIDSISGNDIVLLSAEYNENAESKDESNKSEEKDSDKEIESSDEKKSHSFKKPENGKIPEGFDPRKFSGENPEGFSKSEDGEMPEGFAPSKFSGEKPEGSGKSKGSRKPDKNSKYTLTGEQEELRIPVGTTVTTSLGVKTDFDALSEGDIIKCSVEKGSDGEKVVTEVWIMEQ